MALITMDYGEVGGSGKFFDLSIPLNYASSLVGKNYAIYQLNSGEVLSPKAGMKGSIGSKNTLELGVLGNFRIVYGDYDSIESFDITDFDSVNPSSLNLDEAYQLIAEGLYPSPLGSFEGTYLKANKNTGITTISRPSSSVPTANVVSWSSIKIPKTVYDKFSTMGVKNINIGTSGASLDVWFSSDKTFGSTYVSFNNSVGTNPKALPSISSDVYVGIMVGGTYNANITIEDLYLT